MENLPLLTEEKIERLLALKWWDRSEEYIKNNLDAIKAGDINTLASCL